jgi:hypothetical protein
MARLPPAECFACKLAFKHAGILKCQNLKSERASVSFLHPIECIVLSVLDLDPVRAALIGDWTVRRLA